MNVPNNLALMESVSEETIGGMTYSTMFLLYLPTTYLEKVLIQETNKKIEGEELTWGEFLHCLGLWFFMATVSGFEQRDYFSTMEINNNSGSP